ncbi:MAG: response regulator [Lachnospiraceae bacterium]|jgi:two-component system chemotaxis response regulator CheY|nr:response regulator [Lachnospiraceae bacterium]
MSRILVVDDSRTSRKILRTILEDAGHEVIGEAMDGQDGVNKFKELRPDLVTLDITMPVMDGLEALKCIREVDGNAKVIMVTAAGQQNKMIDAIKLGASEFVTKPFEPEEIIKMVNKLVKQVEV